MSRTDKTRPLWIKALDWPGVTYTDSHDHRDGHCDLPQDPFADFGWRGRGRCCWTWTIAFINSPAARCGCPMCSGAYDNRLNRRTERRAARAALRAGRWDDV